MIQLTLFQIAAMGLTSGLIIGGVGVLLLRRFRSAHTQSNQFTTRFMYSGNLKQTSLLDAIQFLEIGRREGILHLYIGRRKGYVTFVSGQIVDSFYRNTTGKEAIFQMIELNYGDFYFESKTINQPRVIKESIMDIAMEWDARKFGDAAAGGQGEAMWQAPPLPDETATPNDPDDKPDKQR